MSCRTAGMGPNNTRTCQPHKTAGRPAFRSPRGKLRGEAMSSLLQLDGGALLFELFLELLGLGLVEVFLDGFGGGLDQVLGFLEPQAGGGADDLDDLDLFVAGGLEDDVEGGLLLGRGRGATAAAPAAAAR